MTGGEQGQRLGPSERRLRRVLLVISALSAAFAVSYLVQLLRGVSDYPFTVNSVAKDVLLAGVAFVAAADVRRYAWAATTVVIAHLVLASVLALALLTGNVGEDSIAHSVGPGPLGLSPEQLALLWFSADTAIAGTVWWMQGRARMEAFGLRYLGYAQVQALAAMAEILVPRHGEREPTPQQVALRVDGFLASFRAKGKAVMRTALLGLSLLPMLTLRPPLWLMHPAQREDWLRRTLLDGVEHGRAPRVWRTMLQGMLRVAQQLSYLGFYSDPVVARRCGYVPFSERDERAAEAVVQRGRLRTMAAADLPAGAVDVDVVVIGSGAAGATIAARLVAQGREVLILERGRHVDPADFTENELEQFSALYGDGALTLSRDFRFQVLQGMCVGGSTVVNNAVCFDLPEAVLDTWLDPRGLNCGLDGVRLREAECRLRRDLLVHRPPARVLTPGHVPFIAGTTELRNAGDPGSERWEVGTIDANVDDCLGCGQCTIGCRYGRKLSMLDKVLPDAQQAAPEGALRILPECLVQRIEVQGARATAVVGTLADGSEVRVRARSVVVAAGALASSVILARSGLGGDHVGRGLAFNLAVPMFGDFARRIDATAGLQMSGYLLPDRGAGFALETWFQPIVALSLLLPGWGTEHDRTMRRYAHLASIGTVVASAATGRVRPARNPRSVRLDFRPAPADLARLHDGMKLAGRILLQAGASRVLPPASRLHEYHRPAELERLPADLRDPSRFTVSSAHPQGGNRMSQDVRSGVVDPEFRVHGTENVYVCDASVFPSAITVNPQLTVMALADCAADHVD